MHTLNRPYIYVTFDSHHLEFDTITIGNTLKNHTKSTQEILDLNITWPKYTPLETCYLKVSLLPHREPSVVFIIDMAICGLATNFTWGLLLGSTINYTWHVCNGMYFGHQCPNLKSLVSISREFSMRFQWQHSCLSSNFMVNKCFLLSCFRVCIEDALRGILMLDEDEHM